MARGGPTNSTVRRVKTAEGITEILDEAFKGHSELEEVTFSSAVQAIGKSAFYVCKTLNSILCLIPW
eukprot:scaffold4692_cov86-Cylindrotheca_fusiformis.AAC.3